MYHLAPPSKAAIRDLFDSWEKDRRKKTKETYFQSKETEEEEEEGNFIEREDDGDERKRMKLKALMNGRLRRKDRLRSKDHMKHGELKNKK